MNSSNNVVSKKAILKCKSSKTQDSIFKPKSNKFIFLSEKAPSKKIRKRRDPQPSSLLPAKRASHHAQKRNHLAGVGSMAQVRRSGRRKRELVQTARLDHSSP